MEKEGGMPVLTQQEYEYYARRAAFEALLAGRLPADRVRELDLGPEGLRYALVRFDVAAGTDRLLDALMGHFLKYPEYILLDWGPRSYLVIIKAEPGDMDRCIRRCAGALRDSHAQFGVSHWHAAVTTPVDSVEELPGCYETVSRLWAYRCVHRGEHLLTRETVGGRADEEERLLALDGAAVQPERLRRIMEDAAPGEVPGLVAALLEEAGTALGSDAFCCYLALGTRFAAVRFVEERGGGHREFIQSNRLDLPGEGRINAAVLADYMTRVLRAAVRFRDGDTFHSCPGVLRQAAAYVSSHFSQPGLTLEQVAAAVDLSPNYLSALFRREMGCTFVEYLTRRRMELARELLETTDLRSGQIALAVGYRDPRYFSTLFRKTQGMTPREYRAGRKSADGR